MFNVNSQHIVLIPATAQIYDCDADLLTALSTVEGPQTGNEKTTADSQYKQLQILSIVSNFPKFIIDRGCSFCVVVFDGFVCASALTPPKAMTSYAIICPRR